MNTFILWLLVGLGLTLIFSRKGGMGCCGGHNDHGSQGKTSHSGSKDRPSFDMKSPVIDLSENDYSVVKIESKKRRID